MKMKLTCAMAAAAAALATAAPAAADIVFTQGNVAGSLDTVLLSGGALDTFVNGTVGSNNTAVLFTGTENIISPSSGQARIEAADGTLNSLNFNLTTANLGFLAAEFNLNASVDGNTTITVTDQFGNQQAFFNISAAGENFFNLRAINGQVINNVLITSTNLADIRQVRIGDVVRYTPNVPGSVPIPEPATWGLMIIGFGGVGALLRNRRRLVPFAT
jgi:hypothetical protein